MTKSMQNYPVCKDFRVKISIFYSKVGTCYWFRELVESKLP